MASAKQSAGIRLASVSPIMSWEKEAVRRIISDILAKGDWGKLVREITDTFRLAAAFANSQVLLVLPECGFSHKCPFDDLFQRSK